jgi:hypothetical protein
LPSGRTTHTGSVTASATSWKHCAPSGTRCARARLSATAGARTGASVRPDSAPRQGARHFIVIDRDVHGCIPNCGACYGPCERHGIERHQFPRHRHAHCLLPHVGSSKFDSRSLELNAEAGIGLLDRKVASQLKSAFQDDLRRSRELTLETWRQRSSWARVLDWIAYQVHGQL